MHTLSKSYHPSDPTSDITSNALNKPIIIMKPSNPYSKEQRVRFRNQIDRSKPVNCTDANPMIIYSPKSSSYHDIRNLSPTNSIVFTDWIQCVLIGSYQINGVYRLNPIKWIACTDWIPSNQLCVPIASYQTNCVYQLDPIKWIACTDWILSIQLCVPIRLYQTKCAPIGLSQLNCVCRLDPLQEPNKGPNSNQYSNPR